MRLNISQYLVGTLDIDGITREVEIVRIEYWIMSISYILTENNMYFGIKYLNIFRPLDLLEDPEASWSPPQHSNASQTLDYKGTPPPPA